VTTGITMGDGGWIGIGAAAERMIFDAAGDISFMGCNVGIGTTGPGALLDIQSSGNPESRVKGTGANSNAMFTLDRMGDGGNYINFKQNNVAKSRISELNGDLNFLTDGYTQQMTITSAGNVGIGTTEPAALCTINGTLNLWNAGDLMVYSDSPGTALVASIDGATGDAQFGWGGVNNYIYMSDANTYIRRVAAANSFIFQTDLTAISIAPGGGEEVYCQQGWLNPSATGVTSLGNIATPLRWSNVASVLGNFSGNVDIGAGCDVTGNITVTGTVDGVDILAFKTAYDAHTHVVSGDTGAGTAHSHATSKATKTGTYTAGAFRSWHDVHESEDMGSAVVGYFYSTEHIHEDSAYAWTYAATNTENAHTHGDGTLATAAP